VRLRAIDTCDLLEVGDEKLSDLVFKLITTKSIFKKISYDFISATHRNYVTEKRHQNKGHKIFLYRPLPIKNSDYASAFNRIDKNTYFEGLSLL